MQASEAPSKRQQAAFAKLRSELNKAEQACQTSRLQLQSQQPDHMLGAGVDSGRLADVQVRLRRETLHSVKLCDLRQGRHAT